MNRSDGDLLEQWRAGDAASGEVLFERYYDAVERFFLNKITSNIQDLVQETFLRCVESRERIIDNDRFRSYMFAIAYNVLCAYLRETYRGTGVIDLHESSIHDLAPGPFSLVAEHREYRLLVQALHQIPVADQVLLELHYWEQLTTSEMANVLAIPLGTVRGRLQRARARLESAMNHLVTTTPDLAVTIDNLDDWVAGCREHLASYQTTEQKTTG